MEKANGGVMVNVNGIHEALSVSQTVLHNFKVFCSKFYIIIELVL